PSWFWLPEARRSPLGSTASAKASSGSPPPNDDQLEPFHRATYSPPVAPKLPPATSSPPGRTASAATDPLIPDPRADHEEPFHCAMFEAGFPPAPEKAPPAISTPLGSTASALMPSNCAVP